MTCNVANEENHSNYSKPLITTSLILGSFIICWLPLSLFQVVMMICINPMVLLSNRGKTFLMQITTYLPYLQ